MSLLIRVRASESQDVLADLNFYLVCADIQHRAYLRTGHGLPEDRSEGLALNDECFAPTKLGPDAGAASPG